MTHTVIEKPKGMRDTMPLTAAWVRDCREKYGQRHVDQCLRGALAGQRNRFYAVEGGNIVGTPFDWSERAMYIVSMSVLTGEKFIAAIAEPGGACVLGIPAARDGGAST